MATPIDVVVFKISNVAKFIRPQIAEIVRDLPDRKKNSPASETVATAPIVPRICHGQPPSTHSECSRFHPNTAVKWHSAVYC